ncbi:hypothetical protein MNBD_CHLOROFLEXI01-2965 [hydrothermal vent metagenome]|uniref:DUF3179 domain-containing protein n=1 Tax=hydrothermal vent metagenome TaxID=652676 RepID=A0A3B0VSB5_9ZZZZ
MYSREINGEEYTFGVSGKLIRNVLVMYDRQTESYWSQLLGEAVEGELVGTKLTFEPSWMMSWAQWQALHPDTIALDKLGRRGGRDTYDSYYSSNQTGVIPETITDNRLDVKEFVAGVELNDAIIAYPFRTLNDEPVVNDTVGDEAVLVTFDAETAVSTAFSREVDGQTLTFTATDTPFVIQDNETDTTWDALTGVALEGSLAGSQLTRYKSTGSFWFGWKDIHPDTLLYGFDDY